VLETKQAAGRLIRRSDDAGVLILADKRLLTKSYGKSFMKSLPSRNIQECTIAEIVEKLSEMQG
jgi:ATP-dependent DNA helicase DinG